MKTNFKMKESKISLWAKKTSYLFLAISITLFLVYNFSESYVDNNGVLVENFYLLPIGYILLTLSLIFFIVSKRNKRIK